MSNMCVRCKGKTFFTEWTNSHRCFKCEKDMRSIAIETQATDFRRP